jgi:hypothetical protein
MKILLLILDPLLLVVAATITTTLHVILHYLNIDFEDDDADIVVEIP